MQSFVYYHLSGRKWEKKLAYSEFQISNTVYHDKETNRKSLWQNGDLWLSKDT